MYVVKKPLNIGGKRRAAGELLSDGEVTSAAVVRSGFVARVSGLPAASGGGIRIPLGGKTGEGSVEVDQEGIDVIFGVLQASGAEKAVNALQGCTDRGVLLVIADTDTRKSVRTAATEALGKLAGEELGKEGDP